MSINTLHYITSYKELEKKILPGKTLSEINEILEGSGFGYVPPEKITYWLYRRQVKDFIEMVSVPKMLRMYLKEHYSIPACDPDQIILSEDNSKKYIFPSRTGYPVESVYIPDNQRHTLCISTQSGCRMGCRFCHTARMGFHGNLCVDEIINQVRSIAEKDSLTHLVFMGMGEPLDNYNNLLKAIEILTAQWGFAFSPRNITVSTIGIKSRLQEYFSDTRCNIAVSLHSPFDEERKNIIPANEKISLPELLEMISAHKWEKHRRVTFQYVMIKGFNDTQYHLDELIRILKGSNIRVNLMSFHPFEGCVSQSSPAEIQMHFKKQLIRNGISASIRKSRGQDIGAACGLLGATTINKTLY